MSRKVVAAVSDLFFIAKIRDAARFAETSVLFAAAAGDLLAKAREGAQLVILDLSAPNLDAVGALGALRDDPATSGIPTLGYYPHVQSELARRAREAGCDQVLARSQFSRRLVELLRGT